MMSAKVISLNKRLRLRNLQPHYSGRKKSKFKLPKGARWLKPKEIARLKRAVNPEDQVTPPGVSKMRQAIEEAWLTRPPSDAGVLVSLKTAKDIGRLEGKTAAMADMAKIFHEAARLCARK